MSEIEQLPWNGYNVVSTFSGGGGSCLGYRMAGYRVVWANEFIPAAQETYKANHKLSFLNCSNIRDITVERVVEESGLDVGEIDIFDGSPPCASFSTAGSREKHWGHEKAYSDTKQRVDDLFFEYVRMVDGLQPKVFVAENVSGLVKGTAKGVFKEILRAMKGCGYTVSARLLNAKYLGVPQSRERLIFIGVRNDLCERYGVKPAHPKPTNKIVTLGEALDGIDYDAPDAIELEHLFSDKAACRVLKKIERNPHKPISGATVMNGSYFNLYRESMFAPCSTVCQSGNIGTATTCHPMRDRPFTIRELKRITSLPDDFVLTGAYGKQWERCGRMVPPLMMKSVAETIGKEILCKIQ